MGDARRAQCQRCRRHRSEAGDISWDGLCDPCAREAVAANIEQMMDRSGPNFDKWRRSMAACVGGVLLDESRERA
jgi:hypothetical protein